MSLIDGKKGLIFGIANERSIAWHIAKELIAHGAISGFTHYPGDKIQQRVQKTIEDGGVRHPWLMACDVSRDRDLDVLFTAAEKEFKQINFVVHSIAFANKEYLKIGKFIETPRDVFSEALDISAYTLMAIAQRARPLMPAGGSILALSYFGAEKVIPGYNVMGVAKAALEAATRYLAVELGPDNIRVNTISAGPCHTLAAMAIDGIDQMFEHVERKAPLKRNIETEEVGKTALYLISDLSSGVTGENIYVDSGYNIVGL